jgi:predicted type IV restriction endonuclease
MSTIPKKVLLRLTSGIKKFQGVIKTAKEKDLNESDTSAIIIDMLAEIMGYDKYSEITTEYAVKKTYCDLAVKIDDKLKFFIETKAIGIELKSEHIRQAVNYGSNEGLDWVILSNGQCWKVFKIIFGKPLSYELVYGFDLLNLNTKKIFDIEYLYYISKESQGKSALEDFLFERQTLGKFFIGQILISEPVLDSIRKTIRKVCPDVRVSVDEIKSVLIQDVLRREVFDEEKSNEARKRISRILKTPSKPAVVDDLVPETK